MRARLVFGMLVVFCVVLLFARCHTDRNKPIPVLPETGAWVETNTTGAPPPRLTHTAVWTGSVMIVWGGEDANRNCFGDGGLYDPVTDSWSSMQTSGAPSPRTMHTAVWTGSVMIVWGGEDQNENGLGDGGVYDPAANSWSSLTTAGAPGARALHTAVWTSYGMIIWGGEDSSGNYLNTGAIYDPSGGSWSTVSTTGAPAARIFHAAVSTGADMIIWGGSDDNDEHVNSGGIYSPLTNSWSATETTDAPSARDMPSAIWTGNEMIVWGGLYVTFNPAAMTATIDCVNTGGVYDPVADTWQPTHTFCPALRAAHTAVWTGTDMIVWGGGRMYGTMSLTTTQMALTDYNTGGVFDPAENAWKATATAGAPGPRSDHSTVWTGTEMIIWGGARQEFDNNWDIVVIEAYNTGARYTPN